MANSDKSVANGKDQKILQHDIEEIDKKVEEVQEMLMSLRNAWDECILEVRRTGSVNLSASINGGISIRG